MNGIFERLNDQYSYLFQEHMHTPYVVIIYKYLQEWRRLHQSQMPKNYKEKLAFKELIKTGETR